MALVVADRVQETTTTSGTGTFSLAGAVAGFNTFASGIGTTNTTYYAAYDQTAQVWEVGLGTVTSGSPDTLSRDTVLSNSSGTTAKISFAGNTTYVWCDYPASKAVYINATNQVFIGGTTNTNDTLGLTGTSPVTAITARAVSARQTYPASATATHNGFYMSGVGADSASPYTVTNVIAFQTGGYTLGVNQTLTNSYGFLAAAGPTCTNNYGFYASPQTLGTNNYGFYSNVASSSGRWNFYAAGTAANYFAGDTTIAGTTTLATSLTGLLKGTSGVVSTATAGTDYVTPTGTETLTNKTITPRIQTVASAATITPTGDTADEYTVTALAVPATVAAPSGTPADGQRLILRFKDNGTARALTWTTTSGAYRAVGITLPTTTVLSKVTYVGCIYNAQDSYWDAIATVTQA